MVGAQCGMLGDKGPCQKQQAVGVAGAPRRRAPHTTLKACLTLGGLVPLSRAAHSSPPLRPSLLLAPVWAVRVCSHPLAGGRPVVKARRLPSVEWPQPLTASLPPHAVPLSNAPHAACYPYSGAIFGAFVPPIPDPACLSTRAQLERTQCSLSTQLCLSLRNFCGWLAVVPMTTGSISN